MKTEVSDLRHDDRRVYCSSTDIAALFGVRTDTVLGWERSGRFPPAGIKVGTKRYWLISDVEEWLAKNSQDDN